MHSKCRWALIPFIWAPLIWLIGLGGFHTFCFADVSSAPPVHPNLRKGVWFVTMWDTNMDGESNDLDDNLQEIIEKLLSAGIDWVAIKCGDGTSCYLDEGKALKDWIERQGYKDFGEVIAKFHAANIKVLGWQYIYGIPGAGVEGTGGTPLEEAEVAREILGLPGIDGFIVDAEAEYEDEDKDKNGIGDKGTAQKAIEYMEAIRTMFPDSFVAFSSFAAIYSHPWFPYIEFGKYCNAFMPQVYWYTKDPADWLRKLEEEHWNRWHEACKERFTDSIKPIIPTGQGYKVSGAEISKFCHAAYEHGFHVNLYRYEYIDKEQNWAAYLDPSSQEKGLQLLRVLQKPDGSWQDNAGITSMAALAFLNAGCKDGDSAVIRALQYILNKQNTDGSFGDCPTYETSTAIWALVATHNPKYHDEIEAARQYLESIQWDETEGIDENDPRYGGFGYGAGSRPDLSNTQFALMALDAAYDELKLEKSSPADPSGWPYKAIKFVSRCQNRPASNDQEWAHDPSRPSYNDGGFIYYAQDGGVSLAGGTKSYGSMTAAGVWSLRLCGLPVGDVRIKAGLNWLMENEDGDFDDNPGHPRDESHCFLYYYYMTIAKALAMCFVDKLTNGVDWYDALSAKLKNKEMQYEDGHWENAPASHGWEHIPELATAYALLALQTQKPPPANLWMSIILASNADLHIYDPQGRHIGMNYDTGEIENEIPGASFEIDPQGRQIVSLRELEAGTYRIELVGTGTGDYSLTIEGYRDDQVTSTEVYEGTIQEGQTLVGNVTVASTLGELTLYLDTPQPVPSGLIAKAGDRVVDLSWDPYQVSGFDLAGYNVYRSTTKGAGYEKINTELVLEASYHDTGLTNGVIYYYVVTAVDTEGNETDHSREVSATPFADTTPPPAPTITSPTHPDQDEWYDNNDPTFNWTEPDDPSGIAGYSFVLDQTADTIPDETIDTTERTKSYTDVADGIWYFHIRAQDGAGNWGPASHYRIKIRTVFPTAEITFPEDGAAIRATVNITGSASGDDFDYYMVEYGEGENPSTWTLLFSSREPVTQGTLATWDTTQVSEGQYTIRLTVVDRYTYVVQVAVTVLVDNTPPVIQDVLPIEGDFVPAEPTITATLTDNLSGIDEDSILVKLNGSEVDPAPSFDPDTGKMTWTAPASLPDGDYQVTIDVKDKAGNQAQQATTSFTISTELTIKNALNYPNPCSSGTTFTYNLSQEAQVRIEIYTLAGELIKVIEPASGQVGYNEQYWDGTDDHGFPLDNGVYIYRIVAEADGKVVQAIGRLVILR